MQARFNFSWLTRLVNTTEVRVFIGLWVIANGLLLWFGANALPVTLIDDTSGLAHVLLFLPTTFFYMVQVGLVYLVTRNRPLPNWEARTPTAPTALRETIIGWVYALTALIVLGGGFNIGLHLPGTIFDPDIQNSASFIWIWAIVNFIVFAVVPYAVFRWRGYSNEQLSLKSHNLRADVVLIVVILVVESIGEFFGLPDGMRFFSLTPTQMGVGGALTVLIHLLGTGIPIMIFVQSFLVPRYYRMTGSLVAAVLGGGITYATFHTFEYWTLYQSFDTTVVSLAFVYLQFTGAGLVKAIMTLRSGNAWVHLWGYHVIAPHLWTDTSLIVDAFDIR